MAVPTQQQRFLAALAAEGWVKDKPLKGCTVLRHPALEGFYYVGSAGSLRKGRTRSDSLAVNESRKRALLAAGMRP